jgi:hypothetical protein
MAELRQHFAAGIREARLARNPDEEGKILAWLFDAGSVGESRADDFKRLSKALGCPHKANRVVNELAWA